MSSVVRLEVEMAVGVQVLGILGRLEELIERHGLINRLVVLERRLGSLRSELSNLGDRRGLGRFS